MEHTATAILEPAWIASLLAGASVFALLLGVYWSRPGAGPVSTPAPIKLKLGPLRPRRRLTRDSGAPPAFHPSGLRRLLELTGYRGPLWFAAFLAAQALAALLCGGLVYRLAPGSQPQLFAMAGAAAGFLAPAWQLSRIVEHRLGVIAQHLPDAIDLMVLCLSAGLSLDAALRKTAPALAGICPLLASELQITLAELSLLPSRTECYERLGARAGSPQLRAFATHLIEAERHGIAVAGALAAAGRAMREEALAEAQKKAAALPPKLAIPLVVFFMPVLFLIMLGPALMRMLASF